MKNDKVRWLITKHIKYVKGNAVTCGISFSFYEFNEQFQQTL